MTWTIIFFAVCILLLVVLLCLPTAGHRRSPRSGLIRPVFTSPNAYQHLEQDYRSLSVADLVSPSIAHSAIADYPSTPIDSSPSSRGDYGASGDFSDTGSSGGADYGASGDF